jgi:hypothetical protein
MTTHTFTRVTFAPVTNETAKEVRAIVKPIAKAHGIRISVKKGTGSMSAAVCISSHDSWDMESPACRIELCDALIAAGFDSLHAPAGPSNGLAGHHKRMSIEHGHTSIQFSVCRFSIG